MSPPHQGVLLWEIPHTQELPQTMQQRCRELLGQMLLAAVNTAPTSVEEESDEREDPTESY
jgi:DNA-binding protein YbaB